MIGMIAACTKDHIIGVDGKIPWKYPADMKRFKAITSGCVVIMGRKTFESMGRKPLPNRFNIVLQSEPEIRLSDNDSASLAFNTGGLDSAMHQAKTWSETAHMNVWLIGGERVYREGMKYADVIDLTYVPGYVNIPEGAAVARFPFEELKDGGDPWHWFAGIKHEVDPRLERQTIWRESTLQMHQNIAP